MQTIKTDTQQTILTGQVMTRAVLYARTSGDDTQKDSRNINGQLDDCRAYAKEKGYKIVAEIKEDDRGASGYKIDLPGLNRLFDMAQAGEFDLLIVREIDRLARNRTKKAVIKEQLRRYNVQIDYVLQSFDDDPYGRFSENVLDDIAELEREIITMRMMRGRRKKIRAGNVFLSDRVPYGYDLVKQDSKTMLAINDQEAEIVRLIYEWYVIGDESKLRQSIYKIAKKLSHMGILTRGDTCKLVRQKSLEKSEWSCTSVAHILHSETYAGVWHYGRNSDRLSVEVPAIVTREIWEAAQQQFENNRKFSKGNTKNEYLFSKRCTCGVCGYKMAGRTSKKKQKNGAISEIKYYACPAKSHMDYRRECNAPYFRADKVDKIVWEWIEGIFTDPVALDKSLEEFRASQENEDRPIRELLETVETLINKDQARLNELIQVVSALDQRATPRAREALLNEIENVEKNLDALEQQRTELTRQLNQQVLSQRQIDELKAYVAEVCKNLEALKDDIEGRRQILEIFNVQITLKAENKQRFCYVKSYFGKETLPIKHNSNTQPL